jgi:hypothetical protein
MERFGSQYTHTLTLEHGTASPLLDGDGLDGARRQVQLFILLVVIESERLRSPLTSECPCRLVWKAPAAVVPALRAPKARHLHWWLLPAAAGTTALLRLRCTRPPAWFIWVSCKQ